MTRNICMKCKAPAYAYRKMADASRVYLCEQHMLDDEVVFPPITSEIHPSPKPAGVHEVLRRVWDKLTGFNAPSGA